MITYKILHHVPGRIRLEVPSMRGMRLETLRQLSDIHVPDGIRAVRPNPLTGSVVIRYDPKAIDVLEFLRDMVLSPEIRDIIEEGGKNEKSC